MYKAIVTRISTRPLPGADRLLIGSCGPYQVVVGSDTKDGQLGIFFESDGQLSEEFATQNDLIRRKDVNGNPAGGMFEPNRRVKSIKLRGAKSEGFWCPLEKVAYTGVDISTLTEGTQFDELNGHPICNKYFTPATQSARGKKPTVQRDNKMFAKHIDTGMFKRESRMIPHDSHIIITEKLHGTSQRVANVLDEEPIRRNWLMSKVADLFGWPKTRMEWKTLIGTRNVILQNREGDGFHGEEAFRRNCVSGLVLHKGEVLYGEVVGYTEAGKPIMATQSTADLKDKQIQARFGKTIEYAYGCQPGQCKFYVYRITQVNEDGIAIELSWKQVCKRCKELGIETVPVITQMALSERAFADEALQYIVDLNTEFSADQSPLPSLLDDRHIREGVVVRYESEHGTGWLKNKAFVFGVLEGYLKESDDYVDAEESA